MSERMCVCLSARMRVSECVLVCLNACVCVSECVGAGSEHVCVCACLCVCLTAAGELTTAKL